MDAHNRHSTIGIVVTLLGESLREMAVLIMVFAPLDRIVQGKPLTTSFTVVTMGIALVLLGLGIAAEVKQWTR